LRLKLKSTSMNSDGLSGLVYAAVGGAVMFTFIISIQELYSRFDHITYVMWLLG
jgi:hypothetical protein